jgi:hypothetical protein
MNLPSDDDRLIQFLHQNRPEPPPAPMELESQILATISSQAVCDSLQSRYYQQQRLWLIPAFFAASLLIFAWNGYRMLTTPKFSTSEVATLETFLETNWNSVNNSQPVENEWIWE